MNPTDFDPLVRDVRKILERTCEAPPDEWMDDAARLIVEHMLAAPRGDLGVDLGVDRIVPDYCADGSVADAARVRGQDGADRNALDPETKDALKVLMMDPETEDALKDLNAKVEVLDDELNQLRWLVGQILLAASAGNFDRLKLLAAEAGLSKE